MGGCSELLYQWIYLYCGLSIPWVGKLATVYSSSYVSVPIKCIYDLGAVWLGNVTGYPGVFQSNLHLYLLPIKTCTCIYRHWFSWAWVKGLQKPTGTPTRMGLCLQRWPMNLARAVQVSIDTAVQPCKDWKVIWLVLWDFRCFHRCFHGRLVIIWGLCLWGGVWHWSGHVILVDYDFDVLDALDACLDLCLASPSTLYLDFTCLRALSLSHTITLPSFSPQRTFLSHIQNHIHG